ncbi:MAG: hypothetical protein V7L24_13420 [Nostoc sp.]
MPKSYWQIFLQYPVPSPRSPIPTQQAKAEIGEFWARPVEKSR